MSEKQSSNKMALLIGMWFFIILIACNLGTASGDVIPPTLVPRASATPPPTLGFNGQGNNGTTVGLASIQTPVASIGVELNNLITQVDRDRLMAHVDSLQSFFTRHVNSTQSSPTRGIGAARDYIRDEFEAIAQSNGNLAVFTHEFPLTYNSITTTQTNVFAVLGGTELGASTVVVGAHYDSIGVDVNDPDAFAPGANDNGSGVAALLELARVMSQKRYRSTIIFVAFSAEEVGRRGSRAFVDFMQERNVDIIGMINIDAVGNSNDRNGRTINNQMRLFSRGPNSESPSRQMARVVEFLGFAHGANLELKMQDAEDRDGRYGDHFSFSEAGFPAIRFISSLEEKANGDPTDTLEFIEPNYLQQAVQSMLLVVASLADGPLPPRNITLRSSNSGPELRWESVPNAAGYVVALRLPGQLRYDQQIECDLNGTVCTDEGGSWSLPWANFPNYAGIAVAARGTNGIIGRLSEEYQVQ